MTFVLHCCRRRCRRRMFRPRRRAILPHHLWHTHATYYHPPPARAPLPPHHHRPLPLRPPHLLLSSIPFLFLHAPSPFSSLRLLLNGGCGSLLGQMLLHIPDRVNSPGDCFWMGWWGYAKREQFVKLATESHQPSGLGWSRVGCLFSTPLLSTLLVSTLWGGVYPSPYPLPRGRDPWFHAVLGPLVATFWLSCCHSFFHRFFDAIFDASWLDFPSQLASQNPPKSIKNRCQDAFP